MKRLLFIYNPHAGKELLKPKLSDIVDIFVKAGYEVVIYPTQAYQDAYKKVRRYPAGEYDLVVCSGGDGTIDEVVTGMMKRQEKNPIGYIPTGTTNDFANSLHIPRNLLGAADNAVNGVVFPCDVGKFNDGTFVYIAAFGLFTDVSYETKQGMKNVLGHLAYVLEGAGRLVNFPSYHVHVTTDQGLDIEGEFIYGMVSNTVSIGGLVNLPRDLVCLDDGQFEALLIRTPRTAKDWQSILTALTTQKLPEDGSVVGFTCKQAHFVSPQPLAWTVDGEFGGEYTDLDISNRSRALVIACGN